MDSLSKGNKAATGQTPKTQPAPIKPQTAPGSLQQVFPDLYCTLKLTAKRTENRCGEMTYSPLTVQQGTVLKEVTSELIGCGSHIFTIFSFEWEVTIGNKGLVDTNGPPDGAVHVVTSIATGGGPPTQLGNSVIPKLPEEGHFPLKYSRPVSALPAGPITVTTTITYKGQEVSKENNVCIHQFTLQK